MNSIVINNAEISDGDVKKPIANRTLKPISARGIARLEASVKLLPPGIRFIIQANESRSDAILRTIKSLPEQDQIELKGLVDWVEDYGFDDDSKAALPYIATGAARPISPGRPWKGRSYQVNSEAKPAIHSLPADERHEGASSMANEQDHHPASDEELLRSYSGEDDDVVIQALNSISEQYTENTRAMVPRD